MSELDDFGQAYWERRYSGHAGGHAREPNAQLQAETRDLPPGTALDAGCGEGADAIWLAQRGWRVMAVDLAPTALRRAQEHAATLGADVADRIEWVHADLTQWEPAGQTFDLVSSQYVHVPAAARTPLFRRLAAAVAPGGTLLMVGHHPSDRETTLARGDAPELYLTAEEVAAELDPELWEIAVAEARPHRATDPHGHDVAVREAVLRARRRAGP